MTAVRLRQHGQTVGGFQVDRQIREFDEQTRLRADLVMRELQRHGKAAAGYYEAALVHDGQTIDLEILTA